MSSRNEDSTPKEDVKISRTVPAEGDDIKMPRTVPVDDDSLDWDKGSYGGKTRGSASSMELHGDIHHGQEPPEEKD